MLIPPGPDFYFRYKPVLVNASRKKNFVPLSFFNGIADNNSAFI